MQAGEYLEAVSVLGPLGEWFSACQPLLARLRLPEQCVTAAAYDPRCSYAQATLSSSPHLHCRGWHCLAHCRRRWFRSCCRSRLLRIGVRRSCHTTCCRSSSASASLGRRRCHLPRVCLHEKQPRGYCVSCSSSTAHIMHSFGF